MPATSVIALSGPVCPGNGMPRSRPRGRVCAAVENAQRTASDTAMTIRITTPLDLHVAHLDRRLCVRVVRNIADDGRRVRDKCLLKRLDRIKQQVKHHDEGGRRTW